MIIRMVDFKGEVPRLHPRLLPGNFAQVARNTRLENGALGPIHAPELAHTFGSTPSTFIKFNDAFLAFDQPNVNATVGPVAQNRLYYTGDGFPKMRVNGTTYDLAVHGPGNPPSIEVLGLDAPPKPETSLSTPNDPVEGGDPESFTYRYSYIIDGVESVASPQSVSLIRTGDQTITVSDLQAPAGAEKIRIFRRGGALGVNSSTRFGLIAEIAPTGSYADAVDSTPDVTQSPVEEGDKVSTQETITYVYTYVTSFGEESAPSPPSDIIEVNRGDKVEVSVLAPLQADRSISFIRIYRSKTSLSGVTDFYFLKELNAVSQTYEDSLKNVLVEPLPTQGFDVPEPTMLGLISLPNGNMAAHAGRELLFCEPFQPHAWPNKYRLTTDTDIVGLGAFGAYVVVMTEGAPYLVQGSEPSLMVMEKMEKTLPCLSRFSIVDLGYSVAFASYEGLVVISQNGAEVVTRSLFTEEQWRRLNPRSFRASQINGRYVFSYQRVGSTERQTGIIDLSGEQPYYIEADIEPRIMYYDPSEGALYYTEGGAQVFQFDPKTAGTAMRQRWRSKRVVLKGYDNFGAILIEADSLDGDKENDADPDCIIRVYADEKLVREFETVNRAARLPSGFLADRWEVEIEGYLPITAISLATDIFELAEG